MIPANDRVDAEARQALSTAQGREIATFVGTTGRPPDLETDRENVARTFYVLGQSLTKHLIEIVGIRTFANRLVPWLLNGAQFEAAVHELTGKPLEQVRREWLARIEIGR